MGAVMKAYPDEIFITSYLLKLRERHEKYQALVRLGIETGLRVSDLLKLKAGDIKAELRIKEQKTKRVRHIRLSQGLRQYLKGYIKGHGLQQGHALVYSGEANKAKPLSRIQAWRVLRAVAAELGAEAGTHSMRKTYAKNKLQETGSLVAVQQAMGHKSVETTLRYFLDLNQVIAGLMSKGEEGQQ